MEFLLALISVLVGISVYQKYSLYTQHKKLELLSAALANKYSEAAFSEMDETKEEFLKFVSQSREWAFEYIESLQKGLAEFYDVAAPIMAHYENYGRLVSSAHSAEMDKMAIACQKLSAFLPKEEAKK